MYDKKGFARQKWPKRIPKIRIHDKKNITCTANCE